MTKVKVVDSVITEQKRRAPDKNGVTRVDRIQENVLIELAGEVRRHPIYLDENVSAFAPGMYQIDLEKISTVDDYGHLTYRKYYRFDLVPVAAETSQLFKKQA